MIRILRRGIEEQRIALALLALAIAGFHILIAYTFNAFGGTEGVEALFEFLPEGLKAFLKAQGLLAITADGYLASIYRHPIYLIILLGFAIALSSKAVAREIELGTILLLLSRPISRYRMLLARTLAMLAGIVALLAAAILGTWVGSVAVGIGDQVHMDIFLKIQLNGLLLALAIGWYSLFISSISSDGGRVIALAAGVTVLMFFMDFISEIWDTVSWLGPLSVFHYYDPAEIANTGQVSWFNLGILAAVAVAGLTAAIVTFQRRDISR